MHSKYFHLQCTWYISSECICTLLFCLSDFSQLRDLPEFSVIFLFISFHVFLENLLLTAFVGRDIKLLFFCLMFLIKCIHNPRPKCTWVTKEMSGMKPPVTLC